MIAPGFWMNETTGTLKPAVEAYLNHSPMTQDQIAAMRAYFRQWMRGDWQGPVANQLRNLVDSILTVEDISAWVSIAVQNGIDPL